MLVSLPARLCCTSLRFRTQWLRATAVCAVRLGPRLATASQQRSMLCPWATRKGAGTQLAEGNCCVSDSALCSVQAPIRWAETSQRPAQIHRVEEETQLLYGGSPKVSTFIICKLDPGPDFSGLHMSKKKYPDRNERIAL